MSFLLAENTTLTSWPDGIDRLITIGYVSLIVAIPLLGYVFMYLDFRRYLRSLRRALMVVTQVASVTPYWALRERPSCLKALGLQLPCDEQEVIAAYRELAKSMHPDRGGDLQQFLRLQKHFEQALQLVRRESRS